MSGILRGIITRSVPTVRSMIFQKRGIRANKPETPLTTMENIGGLAIISVGCLAIPCWIMTHLEEYKARDD